MGSPAPGDSDLVSRFGEPEAVFRPSRGQTVVGVVICAGGAALCFSAAIFGGEAFDLVNRICWGIFGVMCVAAMYWLFRLRCWRLVLFERGVVQITAWRVDECYWADVDEVVETRYGSSSGRILRATLRGSTGEVAISPVNYHSRNKLFARVVEAASRRGIPVRIEVDEGE